jgi:hypothetical protein
LLTLSAIVVFCGALGLAAGEVVLGLAAGAGLVLLVALPGMLLARPSRKRWQGDEAPRLPSFFRLPPGPQ